jgi:hypothetical protein
MLATVEDLASILLRDDVDRSKATLLIEISTALVQTAAGNQRIVEVVDDTFDIMGTPDRFLALPQIPVTDVTAVTIDGVAPTHWKRFGDRLWRHQGWMTCASNPTTRYWDEPPNVVGTYSHGRPAGSQDLQLGRGAALGLIKGVYGNPTGATSLKIDDYAVMYEKLSAQMDASPFLAAALRSKYGRRAGLVRIG